MNIESIITASVIAGILLFILLCCTISSKRSEKRKALEEERRAEQRKRQWEYDCKVKALQQEISEYLNMNVTCSQLKSMQDNVVVKSRSAYYNYDSIKYFIANRNNIDKIKNALEYNQKVKTKISDFLKDNPFKGREGYYTAIRELEKVCKEANVFTIRLCYVTAKGNMLEKCDIDVPLEKVNYIYNNPETIMTKSEYTNYLKEKSSKELEAKKHNYYNKINNIIELANENKDKLLDRHDVDKLDTLIAKLLNKVINNINKIKTIQDEYWDIMDVVIEDSESEISTIIKNNNNVLNYINSNDFMELKGSCETLMSSQKEFNEYINEKINTITKLFGTNLLRNETVYDDSYSYIRQYKKSITPFSAEVSAAVFASAENSPIEYIIKYFYSNKDKYPEQIQQLQHLIEEIETLKEAKSIIEHNKIKYQKYFDNVPKYIIEDYSEEFYSRLGFANITENIINIEYKFIYTSNGGFAQRYFTVPMTEDIITELISKLQNRLTFSDFTKRQRLLMTSKLRESIKKRDNYTCCNCGNSIYNEPNLLLEIDHIIPVAKGGYTEENNLQTLCWKCNRTKGAKLN